MSTLSVRPLSAACGAAIEGVDLRHPVDDQTFADNIDAWHRHLVVVFPGQDLDTESQLRFARRFGELEEVRNQKDDPDAVQYVMYVANRPVGDSKQVLPDGEMFFHYDQCYYPTPCVGTMLFGIEVPPTGGDTLFANAYTAFEDLPDELKAAVEGRTAMNIYDYEVSSTRRSSEYRPEAPRAEHPIVVEHPVTGRPALYVNRLMTAYVCDMEPDESDALLARLFEHVEQEKFVYRHRWTAGDLLLWDNRCTLHARTDFDPNQSRVMRRLTIRATDQSSVPV